MICATSVDKIPNYGLTCPSAQGGTGELRVQLLTLLGISSFPNCLQESETGKVSVTYPVQIPPPPHADGDRKSRIRKSRIRSLPHQGQVREVGKG
jgi:hypothetical protein